MTDSLSQLDCTDSAPAEESNDPLLYGLPLPLERELFPVGFPLRISTNSEYVLNTAAQVWSRFPKLFDRSGVRMKILVTDGGGFPSRAPILRGQENLLSIVADHSNFASADLRAGFGYICCTPKVASNPAYFRYHFLEPLAYVLIAARYVAFVHAASIALGGRAILLCGGAGSGKTCLAFACARSGWTFLSGDATAIVRGRKDYRIVGRPFEIRFRHTASRLFPELEKYPLVLRPSGKTDIEVDPRDLNLRCAMKSTASRLVFLDRVDLSIPASVEPVCPAEARRRLEESIRFGDHSIRSQQGRTLDQLVELPASRLRYSDLGSAERALRSLIAREA
jgi:hypothetical protein